MSRHLAALDRLFTDLDLDELQYDEERERWRRSIEQEEEDGHDDGPAA